jgi:copper(I)-binding protein
MRAIIAHRKIGKMTMRIRFAIAGLLLACGWLHTASAAGRLQIEQAWIRSAAPGAMMLAGYATLRNSGDAPLIVTAASSADFGDVSLHQSSEENGVARMRALADVVVAPGERVVFAPGGKHFMLMKSKRELKPGDSVKIHLDTKVGDGATAEFVVRDDAP